MSRSTRLVPRRRPLTLGRDDEGSLPALQVFFDQFLRVAGDAVLRGANEYALARHSCSSLRSAEHRSAGSAGDGHAFAHLRFTVRFVCDGVPRQVHEYHHTLQSYFLNVTMKTATTHTLKISLLGVTPSVWRRVVLPSDTALDVLHDIIQVVMGWNDSHLHVFRNADGAWGAHFEGDEEWQHEACASIASIAPSKGSRFSYEYDFGDGWEHDVVVETIEPMATAKRLAVCLGGARACPPDDCGGPFGYGRMLDILTKPRHAEHAEIREWIGKDFDAAHFDASAASLELATLKMARPLKEKRSSKKAAAVGTSTMSAFESDDELIRAGLDALSDRLPPNEAFRFLEVVLQRALESQGLVESQVPKLPAKRRKKK